MKRYDFDIFAGGPSEDDDGEYVLYTDHAAALANRDAEIEIYKGLLAEKSAALERARVQRKELATIICNAWNAEQMGEDVVVYELLEDGVRAIQSQENTDGR